MPESKTQKTWVWERAPRVREGVAEDGNKQERLGERAVRIHYMHI